LVWVAGADGCKKGWFRASRETETGEVRFAAMEEAAELVRLAPRPEVLALDIPIGLTEAGPRECDRLARQCLGWPRRNSVFPAPVRPALNAESREQASRLTAQRDGRRVGAQAWALYPKIRAVDELLASNADGRLQIREVHPEVSFWRWNQRRPIAAGKKSQTGKRERLQLVAAWLGESTFEEMRGAFLKRDVADDDILDALAALWTATRVVEGRACTLPDEPPVDVTGLPMEIVY
jgi:predicted RNase H-like nuclease